MRWGLAKQLSWPDIKLKSILLPQHHPLYSMLGLQVCHHTPLTQKSKNKNKNHATVDIGGCLTRKWAG